MHIAALNLDSIACVQDLYGDDRRVWNGLFELFSKDLAEATSAGIDLGYQRGKFFPIVLGNKGDWSYLVPQTMHVLTFLFSRAVHCCIYRCACIPLLQVHALDVHGWV